MKLQKEPENQYDAQAIAFMCKAETTFERIGYVVKEALPDFHKAMDENKVLQVRFDHIKCITKAQVGMQALLLQGTENGQILYYIVNLLIRN